MALRTRPEDGEIPEIFGGGMRVLIAIIAAALIATPFFINKLDTRTEFITKKRLDFLEQRVTDLEFALKGGKR